MTKQSRTLWDLSGTGFPLFSLLTTLMTLKLFCGHNTSTMEDALDFCGTHLAQASWSLRLSNVNPCDNVTTINVSQSVNCTGSLILQCLSSALYKCFTEALPGSLRHSGHQATCIMK